MLWLGRFVVYTREGVRLDFDWVTPGTFVAAEAPEEQSVVIRYDDGNEPVVEKSRELEKLAGCTVTIDMLTDDLAAVDEAIRQQPKGTAVLLELKSGTGNFYYKTTMPNAKVSSKVDTDAVKELLKQKSIQKLWVVTIVL